VIEPAPDSASTSARPGGSERPAVVYFGKLPRPGLVKTRLCPPLTPLEAASLYGAFLREIVVPVPGARTLFYGHPPEAAAAFSTLVPAGVEVRPQVGAGLWERLARCFRELFDEGHERVVVRGTDAPDLPRERVLEALARTRPGRVVLGPDFGGGFYLVGLPRGAPDLLPGDDVPAERVLQATIDRAHGLGLETELLAAERDVDTFDDLLALWRDRLARRHRAPPTAG
jgi:rSAM/selenodomain-associated transferase 1